MKNIRSYYLPFLMAALFSCNSKENKPTEKPVTNSPDTSHLNIVDNKSNPYAIVDISPMDMCYFPSDYPILKMQKSTNTLPLARIIYSRPHLQGRRLFRDLLKYGESWRLGANESTELDLYTDASIQDKKIKAGRYVLYCIPQADSWTIILNSNIDSWGLHPDSTKDIAHFTIPVKKVNSELEYFTIIFEKNEGGADILMAWDNIEARLPVVFPK